MVQLEVDNYAESYLKFMEETMRVYGVEFKEWCVALVGDNASCNTRLSSLTNIPHVGCNTHTLNLEVRYMIERQTDLSTTLTSVHEIMRNVKSKLKNTAVLRKLTKLKPLLSNDTRWSGKVAVVRRFIDIKEQLIEASEHEDSDFFVNTSSSFKSKTKRYFSMLSEINVVTKSLQEKGRTLAQSRKDFDTLIGAVREEKNVRDSKLYGCRLGTKYIGSKLSYHSLTIF